MNQTFRPAFISRRFLLAVIFIFLIHSTVLLAGNAFAETVDKTPFSVTSPNGKLTFRFEIRADQTLGYAVSFQGKDVVLPSKLGISGFDSGFTAAGTTDVSRDETWKNPFGERAVVRDCFHGKTIHLTRRGIPMDLEVRAYDEGIAFRYHFLERPDGSGNDLIIRQDLTEYVFPEGTQAWFAAHAQGTYSLLPLENWPAEAERPLVLREPDGTSIMFGRNSRFIRKNRTR